MEGSTRVYVRGERKTQRLTEEASVTPIDGERRGQARDAVNKCSSSASSANSDSSSPAAATVNSLLLPNLPDDIALQCMARVPRFNHIDLSLVSKSWNSMLRSPLFFSTRARLNCTQHLLYLNVNIYDYDSSMWFVLEQNPSNPSNPRILSPVPPISSHDIGSDFAVLGSKIYVLDVPSSTVWIFDCRFNRWEIGPKMRVKRVSPAVGVLNGKIYVMGGCVNSSARSTDWAEVFDPSVGSWTPIPSPPEVSYTEMDGSIPSSPEVSYTEMDGSIPSSPEVSYVSSPEVSYAGIEVSVFTEEKFYAIFDGGGVVFDPCDSSWRNLSTQLLPVDWTGKSFDWKRRTCVVDEILYYCNRKGEIRGLDVKDGKWKELKWVQKDFPAFLHDVQMANVGGRLCVVWEEAKGNNGNIRSRTKISCAEVEIRNDSNGGLWGSVVWSEVILVIPRRSVLVRCLAVEL